MGRLIEGFPGVWMTTCKCGKKDMIYFVNPNSQITRHCPQCDKKHKVEFNGNNLVTFAGFKSAQRMA